MKKDTPWIIASLLLAVFVVWSKMTPDTPSSDMPSASSVIQRERDIHNERSLQQVLDSVRRAGNLTPESERDIREMSKIANKIDEDERKGR